ncbi:helix-turn-helix domain-containing protein [Ruminococcus flavefaciens]|uniref:helix-turn-helix domain-containing protein n=1 Tax=Ruminococcus flavefaciens TaxID=1265 RepID=UPI0026ED88EB|nr:helix-turn-helix transcriptional regulator [Ruminococcus flavefaciens]
MKKFCEFLKNKRTEANLTQDQLADLMNVSLNAVQNWESGRTSIKKTRLYDLAKALKTDTVELEAVYNDDGEDFSNFPSFMYTDEQNSIISTLRLTPEQKEFMMMIKIYNSNNWDRVRNKPLDWSFGIMNALRKIPYKYTEDKGVFKLYELGIHLENFLRYVPASFCFEMIRNSPDTVFDIRTLDKIDILKWMNLCMFGESLPHTYNKNAPYYTIEAADIMKFQEITRKLDEWKYREEKEKELYRRSKSKTTVELIEDIFNDEDCTITTKLSKEGVLFKEWFIDLTNSHQIHND